MTRTKYIQIFKMAAFVAILALSTFAQRTTQISRPCAGSTTPATVAIDKSGNVVLAPCVGSDVVQPNQQKALRFDASKAHHVDHGAFWTPANTYGVFMWDGLLRPTDVAGSGYFISAGYGPSHNLLAGFSGDGVSKIGITGNIYMNGVLTSYTTPAVIPVNAWSHVMITWDLSNIVVWVNGIAVSATPAVGTLRTATGGADNVLFVGGSDHANVSFDLAWLRGFENVIPWDTSFYTPVKVRHFPLTSFYVSGAVVKASFAADYTTGSLGSIADLSDGVNGVRHAGYRSRGINAGDFDNPSLKPQTSVEADLPQYVSANIVKYVVPATPAIPATARIFDSFTSRDITPFWDDQTAWVLGSTEGGTLGVKPWSSAAYCVTYGQAAAGAINPGFTTVDNESSNFDVRVSRSGTIEIVTNYLNASNYLSFTVNGSYLGITKKIAGVDTNLFYADISTTTTSDLRAVVSGTAVSFYADGVLKASVTASGMAAATRAGFEIKSYTLARVDKFEIY